MILNDWNDDAPPFLPGHTPLASLAPLSQAKGAIVFSSSLMRHLQKYVIPAEAGIQRGGEWLHPPD